MESTYFPGLLRVFIGIGCDAHVQEQAGEIIEPLKKTLPGTRWVAPVNRHLTLAFLGDIPASGLDSLMHEFDRIYQGERSFTYRLTRLCRFPNPSGSIIALTGEPEGPVKDLYQTTMSLLKTVQLQSVRNIFRPHITLGRIKNPEKVRSKIDQRTKVDLRITKITLYQSTLTPGGSIYTTLKESWLHSG